MLLMVKKKWWKKMVDEFICETYLQHQTCSRCFSSTGLRIEQQRRRDCWKRLRQRLKEKRSRVRNPLLWNMGLTMWPILLSRYCFSSIALQFHSYVGFLFPINCPIKTSLQNKAQLVVIAHDVDPVELVVWLPALCRKMEIPYCIVKGKARLGAVIM